MHTPGTTHYSDEFTHPQSLWRVVCIDWKWWLLGAIFSFLIASLLMSGWPAGLLPNLSYPYLYEGDALSHAWFIKRLLEGWVFNNPHNGYPFGSNFMDYPSSDIGNFLVIKLIGLMTGQYYSTLNLYFLLSFPVVFITAFSAFRAIGLTVAFAFSAGFIFTFLPFHIERLNHLFFTWYFVVPLFYYAALKIFYSDTSIGKTDPSLIKNLFWGIGFVALACFGVYYALFGVIILMVVAISGLWDEKINLRSTKLALLASCLVILGVLLNLIPNLIHWYLHGLNPEAVRRSVSESELYGFKFVQLILPHINHRIPYLAHMNQYYSSQFPLINENAKSSLGFLGSIGLVSIFIIIFAMLSNRRINNPTLRMTALIVLVLFMFGTIGGFGTLFALFISPAIRGWNRISVFIGFGTLLVLFIILQTEVKKRLSMHRFTIYSSLLAIILMFIGVYEQTSRTCTSCNQKTAELFYSNQHLIQAIENTVPIGSAIYQLPYASFPEEPPMYHMDTYEQLIGFLHSSSIYWSAAGMRGRPGDLFYHALSKEPISKQLQIIQRLGFAGIYINRKGFADHGQAIIRDLTTLLGKPPALVRADGEIVFFRLEHVHSVNLTGLDAVEIMKIAGYHL